MRDVGGPRATVFSADWHARRAEDLVARARSASMAGWWKRGRRRELLAAAHVHAVLGAVAMRVDPPPAPADVDSEPTVRVSGRWRT